jgi:hypothetical protein
MRSARHVNIATIVMMIGLWLVGVSVLALMAWWIARA